MKTRVSELLTNPIVMICIVVGLWIGAGVYFYRNMPSETQSARNRLTEIQQALKGQKQMVDSALMYEGVLANKEPSPDSEYRIQQLLKYRRMLEPIEKEW